MSEHQRTKPGLRLATPGLGLLLPLACLASAAALFSAELMTSFEFVPPGREALDEQTAGDRHGYALAVVAAFAFAATLVAVFAASKPAAVAVAIAGILALLVFLLVDLPDAGSVGTLDDPRQSFFDAEAVPRAGFWLGLAGALGLAVTGIALATLGPDQLAALRPRRRPSPLVGSGPSADGEDRQARAVASSNSGSPGERAAPGDRGPADRADVETGTSDRAAADGSAAGRYQR